MLGMRRPPPPASLDDLELERSVATSKVRKDDALSIYDIAPATPSNHKSRIPNLCAEATLQKLRRGSRRAFCNVEISNSEPSASEAAASPSCVCKPDDNLKPMEINQEEK
ncbi:hypothetical protein Taro_004190 [Colocasia esculenta]|uniref:Uncharacterized protein n=1 Tax=Colocasia esculenta TaxID=4460 RepID=A0A843TQZ5_COLES|nr:hypothetical protein [Colocasia esculenta]